MGSRFQSQVVWITGGGSGIGEALALAFAYEGARVAISGRRMEKLKEACRKIEATGSDALAVQCDVTDESQIIAAVARIVEEWGRLDVAVANAGFGVGGTIAQLSAEDWRRQLDTNVVGAALTARHALPELLKQQGRVVLVGSVAGTLPSPENGAYHASKYAVRAIGQTLAIELAGTGVSCTTIQPGFVESEIGQVDKKGEFHPEWQDRRPKLLMWSAERAAQVCVDAIADREREFTFTGHGKLAVALGKHAPDLVHAGWVGYARLRGLKGGAAKK